MSNMLALVVAALIQVESGGNDFVVGDSGRSIGCLQIRRIAVDQANRIVGERRWTYGDRYDRTKSVEMCRVTLERQYRRGVRDPVKLACKWRDPNRVSPEWYRKRVRAALKG